MVFLKFLENGAMDKDVIKQERGQPGHQNRVGDQSLGQEEGLHGQLEFVQCDLHGVIKSSYKRSARMRNVFYHWFYKWRNWLEWMNCVF